MPCCIAITLAIYQTETRYVHGENRTGGVVFEVHPIRGEGEGLTIGLANGIKVYASK
jgi:hypothetical protein